MWYFLLEQLSGSYFCFVVDTFLPVICSIFTKYSTCLLLPALFTVLLYWVLVLVLDPYLSTIFGYWYLYLHAKYWYLYWYLDRWYCYWYWYLRESTCCQDKVIFCCK